MQSTRQSFTTITSVIITLTLWWFLCKHSLTLNSTRIICGQVKGEGVLCLTDHLFTLTNLDSREDNIATSAVSSDEQEPDWGMTLCSVYFVSVLNYLVCKRIVFSLIDVYYNHKLNPYIYMITTFKFQHPPLANSN